MLYPFKHELAERASVRIDMTHTKKEVGRKGHSTNKSEMNGINKNKHAREGELFCYTSIRHVKK